MNKKVFSLFVVLALFSLGTSAQSRAGSGVEPKVFKGKDMVEVEGSDKTLDNKSGLKRGSHGFVDCGYNFGNSDYDFGRFEVSTTHGYQFNPYIFLGAGVGFHFASEYTARGVTRERSIDVPVYADLRLTPLNYKFAPFVEGRIGQYINNSAVGNHGMLANVAFGCRTRIKGHSALSLIVGYSVEELEFKVVNHYFNGDYFSNLGFNGIKTKGITVKIGYEF